jgi:hypothetical protein
LGSDVVDVTGARANTGLGTVVVVEVEGPVVVVVGSVVVVVASFESFWLAATDCFVTATALWW